jgi:lysophospholipase L1-like esterase
LLASVTPRWVNAPDRPFPRPEPEWLELHRNFSRRAAAGGIDLLFLGDSITQGWSRNAVWRRHYEPRGAANFGIGGERTQHLLWRIEHGTLDGADPRVVVLMIGTNNVEIDKPDAVARGVAANLAAIRERLPRAKVILMGILPRGVDRKQARAKPADPRVPGVNERLARLADGRDVVFVDVGARFLNASGNIPARLMPDFLHPSDLGYQALAEGMEPVLWALFDEPRGS